MQIILLTLLAWLAFVLPAQAFNAEGFADDFYNKIRQKVEVEEPTIITERIAFQTGLSQGLIFRLLSNLETAEDTYTIQQWCNTDDTIQIHTRCEEDLYALMGREIDLAALENEIYFDASADEIWANGTLYDSPFDLVVDLNTIDVLLFGSEAEIPLARWSKNKKDKLNVSVGKSVNGDSDFIFPEDTTNGEGGKKDGNINPEDTTNETTSEDKNTGGVKFTALLDNINASQGPLQCSDSRSFVLLSFNDVQGDNNGGSGSGAPKEGNTAGGASEGQTGGNGNANSNNDNFDADGDDFDDDPLTANELCENPLYGGFYCKESLDDTDSCDPSKGVCKNCFGGEDIRFCITWEFKTSQHSLFSSTWVEDSVFGYTQAMVGMYRNLLGAGPLTPKNEENQAGFLTHLSDFIRLPGKILYIEGKIPDYWTNEPKQLAFDTKDLTSDWRRMRLAFDSAYDSERQLFSPIHPGTIDSLYESDSRRQLDIIRADLEMKELKRQYNSDDFDTYYRNIRQNLIQFHDVYKHEFESQFWSFPYEEVKLDVACKK